MMTDTVADPSAVTSPTTMAATQVALVQIEAPAADLLIAAAPVILPVIEPVTGLIDVTLPSGSADDLIWVEPAVTPAAIAPVPVDVVAKLPAPIEPVVKKDVVANGSTEEETEMPVKPPVTAIRKHLFPSTPTDYRGAEASPEMSIFAVLDGAKVKGLPRKLHALKPESVCLYTGDLAPDIAYVAPYVVRIEPEHPFTSWLLEFGWGKSWGIFAEIPSSMEMRLVRKHFRSFLNVTDPDGKTMKFRYYDPRVFRKYLPTCNEEETEFVFGPVKRFIMEDEIKSVLVDFVADKKLPRATSHLLGAV